MLFSPASAVPPAITYLYPAGAQRGTTVEVTAAGTLDANTKVRATRPGVSVEVVRGKLKVTASDSAPPGVYWLRAYNAEGASALRPFVIGTLPEVTEKEPNDDFKKPHVLDGSFVVNGKLDAPTKAAIAVKIACVAPAVTVTVVLPALTPPTISKSPVV